MEAVDADAARVYREYGFIDLPEDEMKLFLPMRTIVKAFAKQRNGDRQRAHAWLS
jgi:hypothetical protein